MLRFADDFGHVQERLGRNAAAVQADAARVGLGIDHSDLEAQVGRVKGSGVPAGTGTNHH